MSQTCSTHREMSNADQVVDGRITSRLIIRKYGVRAFHSLNLNVVVIRAQPALVYSGLCLRACAFASSTTLFYAIAMYYISVFRNRNVKLFHRMLTACSIPKRQELIQQ